MSAVADKPDVGCYDLRGPDPETALIGPITAGLMDADRLVRAEWASGFPNWALYRSVLAGDTLHDTAIRDWVTAFAYRVTQTVVRADAYSDELAYVAGHDALAMVRANREVVPYSVVAGLLGVSAKTYKRLRDLLFRMLRATVDEYWMRLGIAYRYTLIAYKKSA